ncbi:MAG: superoxide dismutase [Alphaproteobacteria bacterium]|nr:superoxide dismutase [Alphaproteobacteria bacterium]
MSFELNKLNYALDALAPFMSQETLEYHYGKHHQTYVNNLNNLLENNALKGKSLEEIVKESYGKDAPIFNNAAQHYNHIEFWNSMTSKGGKLTPKIEKVLTESFGSVDKFKEQIIAAGLGVFGSGWVWLAQNGDKLEIIKCPNAENPLIAGKTPILGCDVWEHSYYIDYRNRRADFLKAWFENLINWEYVESRLK